MGRNRSITALLAAMVIGVLPACTLTRTVVYNFADLDDHRIFENRTVARAATVSALRPLPQVPRFIRALQVPDREGALWRLGEYLERTETAAFVVLREDMIVYERYARGFDERSLLNSFSIAKAVIGMLTGIALAEGHLASLDQPVERYRPELADTAYGKVTLRRLLTMTSGVVDRPSLLPRSAEYYYGDDLLALAATAVRRPPATPGWHYSEGDVQVLGFVLEGAVGRPVSAYLAEKLWQPLGMEADALWALDRAGGVEKAFCCISARARDFARLGRLLLDGGRWRGRQLVPAPWATHSALAGFTTPDGYTHRQLWWIPPGRRGDFLAYGHSGQYLYVDPSTRTVIVKFSQTKKQEPVPMFRTIARALAEPAHLAEIERLGLPTAAANPHRGAEFALVPTPAGSLDWAVPPAAHGATD